MNLLIALSRLHAVIIRTPSPYGLLMTSPKRLFRFLSRTVSDGALELPGNTNLAYSPSGTKTNVSIFYRVRNAETTVVNNESKAVEIHHVVAKVSSYG